MTEELPEGWAQTTLGEVTEPKVAQTTPSGSSHFTYIDIAGINNTRKVIADAKSIPVKDAPSRARQLVEAGDVLVSMTRPNLNAVAIVPAPLHGSIASTGFHVLRPKITLPEWVFSLVRSTSFVATLSELVQGALYPAVRPKDIRDFQIPLPPLAEQRRIVAKIEELTARSNAARAALSEVPAMLEQFRQSVLASAFRGDLTADWRAKHLDTETASEVLARIRVERRKQWEARFPKRNYVAPVPVDDSELPELPDGWEWSGLGILGLDPLNPIQTGPFGAQLHASEFVADGVPVIAVGNLTGRGFTRENLYFITREKSDSLARYEVNAGDLLFARSGATLGKVCVAPSYVDGWRMTGHILRARLNLTVIAPRLAALAIWGLPAVKESVTARIRGMTRPGFNTSLLEEIPIPVANPEEQIELLKRIDEVFAVADRISALVNELSTNFSALSQSILAKAFRGELVPQDPTDEPASVLLERIRSGQSEPKAPKAITRGKLSRIVLLLLHHWNNAASREMVDRGMLLMIDDDLRQRLASGGSKPKRKKRGTSASAPPISFPHLLGAMIDAGFVTAKMKGSVQTLHANTQKAKLAHDTADAADLARLRETMKVMELIEEKQLDAELAEAFRGQEIALTV